MVGSKQFWTIPKTTCYIKMNFAFWPKLSIFGLVQNSSGPIERQDLCPKQMLSISRSKTHEWKIVFGLLQNYLGWSKIISVQNYLFLTCRRKSWTSLIAPSNYVRTLKITVTRHLMDLVNALWVGFIYTFWIFLSSTSTSSTLEWLF